MTYVKGETAQVENDDQHYIKARFVWVFRSVVFLLPVFLLLLPQIAEYQLSPLFTIK